MLYQYRQKQFWKDNIYVNEDYSQRTAELKKQLVGQKKRNLTIGEVWKVCV